MRALVPNLDLLLNAFVQMGLVDMTRNANGGEEMSGADRDELATMTVPEAAKILRLSRTTAYRLAAEQKIPNLAVGRSRRVPVAALAAMLGSVGVFKH